MSAISYKRFRKNPDKVIEEVVDAEEAVTVTREDGRDVGLSRRKSSNPGRKPSTFSAARRTPHACGRRSRKSGLRLPAAVEVWWSKRAREDIAYWRKRDPSVVARIQSLIGDIKRSPYSGLGKPEPLKHLARFSACAQRRLIKGALPFIPATIDRPALSGLNLVQSNRR